MAFVDKVTPAVTKPHSIHVTPSTRRLRGSSKAAVRAMVSRASRGLSEEGAFSAMAGHRKAAR